MALQPEQVQRKRKRQSDPAYTLVRRPLYYADGMMHFKPSSEGKRKRRTSPSSRGSLAPVSTEPPNRVAAETNSAFPFSLPIISIPAVRSLNDKVNDAQRNLVGPIRPQYLRDASCLDEFRSVFTQAIYCHRVVYTKMGDLHRNLSPNKIMFTRSDHCASLGFLQDWDQAKYIPAHEASPLPSLSSSHRTGETPFMAFELLREIPPLNVYRHDLESFLYILIWCSLHFNLKGSEVPGINGVVARWTYRSWEAIHDAKSAVVSNVGDRQEKILNAITPAFRPLGKWIEGLFDMFEAGDRAIKDRNKRLRRGKVDAPGAWNEETAGGLITYEKFMAAIGASSDLECRPVY